MVLKFFISILIVLLMSSDNSIEGPLLTNYKSKIKKELNAIKDNNDIQITYENLNLDYHNIEAYTLNDDQEQLSGYLFIKEVKACSLNGCIAKTSNLDDIGSEYYDIAVLADKHKVIKSVKVLDYFSDYGYQITSKKYLKKYRGKNLCDFQTSNSVIDGISGATISYNALISSLGEFCELLQ